MSKMTDEQIIKALECCTKPYCNNNECPLHQNKVNTKDCITQLSTNALDLINRQQAEIEKFKKIETTVNEFWCVLQKFTREKLKEKPTLEELLEYIEHTRGEAIKEFAERLHTEINRVTGDIIQERNERLDEIESSNIVIPFDNVLCGYNSKLQAYDHINGFIHLQYKEMVGEGK